MLYLQLLTGLSTVLAMLALGVSYRALKVRQAPRSAITELDMESAQLRLEVDSLRRSFKRLNARVGMREAREKRDDDTHAEPAPSADEWAQRPGETPDDWKRRLRRGPLARGERPSN